MLAFQSYRAWADVKSMSPEDTDLELQSIIQEGLEDLNEGHPQEALEKFISVRKQAPKGVLYVTATQNAARILAEQGNLKQAYDWLYPLQNRLSPDYVRLLQHLAYRVQEWETAVKIGQQAYQQEPSVDTALINALSYAIMGEATPAVGWLRCAVQLGLPDTQKVIEKREFDAIRDSKAFQNWLKSLEKGKS
jgi:tetratricopeptide (TPR) repeat protein